MRKSSRQKTTQKRLGWLARSGITFLIVLALLSAGDYLQNGQIDWPGKLLQRRDSWLGHSATELSDLLQKSPAFRNPARTATSAPAPAEAPAAQSAVEPADARVGSVPGYDLTGRIARVSDGDTVDVRVEGQGTVRVRLHGIDAPESDQPFGRAARRALSRLVAGETVSLSIEDIDDYGRIVARLYVDGLDVNEAMVRSGHAWWYRRYARFDRGLRLAEKEARDAGQGLWRDSDPMPPWEWRHR